MSATAPQAAEPAAPASLAVALLVAGTFFMENLDATVITPALPHMAASFGVAPVDLNVGVSAYMLTLGVFIPISGWIADRYGSRRVFTAAILLFTLASLLCAVAQSLPQFVAARILQGAGGAMMVPVGRLVVLRVTPRHDLVRAIAALTWPALVAPVLGPPLGGLITDHADWRWIFYLNLPLGLLACAAALRLFPDERADARPPFDWPGFVLTGAALFGLLWAAEELSRPQVDWAQAGAFGLAGAALLALSLRHLRRAAAPMIGLASLRVPTFAVAIWGGSLFRMGVSAAPFLLPLMFQLGFGYTAAQAGAMLMAVFAGNLLMKPLTTPILRRWGFKPVLLGNGLLNAAALAACALFTREASPALMCAVLFVGGMTRSMQFTTFNTIAFADVDRAQMNAANTLFSTAFQLAMGLGVALGAIALRLGERWADAAASPAAPFQFAFVVVGLVSLASLWDSLRLGRGVGEHLVKRAP